MEQIIARYNNKNTDSSELPSIENVAALEYNYKHDWHPEVDALKLEIAKLQKVYRWRACTSDDKLALDMKNTTNQDFGSSCSLCRNTTNQGNRDKLLLETTRRNNSNGNSVLPNCSGPSC